MSNNKQTKFIITFKTHVIDSILIEFSKFFGPKLEFDLSLMTPSLFFFAATTVTAVAIQTICSILSNAFEQFGSQFCFFVRNVGG